MWLRPRLHPLAPPVGRSGCSPLFAATISSQVCLCAHQLLPWLSAEWWLSRVKDMDITEAAVMSQQSQARALDGPMSFIRGYMP